MVSTTIHAEKLFHIYFYDEQPLQNLWGWKLSDSQIIFGKTHPPDIYSRVPAVTLVTVNEYYRGTIADREIKRILGYDYVCDDLQMIKNGENYILMVPDIREMERSLKQYESGEVTEIGELIKEFEDMPDV